jgi:hypothetical protein
VQALLCAAASATVTRARNTRKQLRMLLLVAIVAVNCLCVRGGWRCVPNNTSKAHPHTARFCVSRQLGRTPLCQPAAMVEEFVCGASLDEVVVRCPLGRLSIAVRQGARVRISFTIAGNKERAFDVERELLLALCGGSDW